MRILSIGKDEKQAQALLHLKGACIYDGCIGNGKSSLILSRAFQLIKDNHTKANHVLVLTHDDLSTKDMMSSYSDLTKEEEMPQFYTMNRLCLKLMLAYEQMNDIESVKTLKMHRCVKNLCLDAFAKNFNDQQVSEIVLQLNKCYSMLMSEDKIKEIKIEDIDFSYLLNLIKKFKNKQKVRDMNDVKMSILNYLEIFPNFLEELGEQYDYILVDDAQSLTFIDHLIIKLLNKEQNIFFTANENACFDYKSGGNPRLITDLYENIKVITNTLNYRSSKSVVDYAIKLSESKPNKLMIEAVSEEVVPCSFKAFKDKIQIDEYVLKVVDFNHSVGFIYRDLANAIPLIDTLIKNDKSFQLRNSLNDFFESDIIVELGAWIRLIKDPKDLSAFQLIYDKMDLALTETQFHNVENLMNLNHEIDLYQAMMGGSLKNAQKSKLVSRLELIRVAQNLSSDSILDHILNDFGYLEYLKKRSMDEDHPSIIALRIMTLRYPNVDELWERFVAIKNYECSSSAPVVFASVTKINGCEFDDVFIVDCVNSIFPNVSKEHPDYLSELDGFIYSLARARKRFELLAYKQSCGRRARISDFMYALCAKEENEVKETVLSEVKEIKLARGSVINHKNFGQGVIKNISGGKMVVAFTDEEKMLSVAHCQKFNMIEIIK